METIGLIAAMTQESNALLRRIEDKQRIVVGRFRGHRFEMAGRACVLVTSGMGLRRAAEAAQCLVDLYKPQCLISFGIAGAVEPDLEIGDVVEAAAYFRLDAGGLTPGWPLAGLPETAREAVVQALAGCNARLFTGTAITTGGSQFVPQPAGAMAHPVLEMETAGIAQAAGEKGIPLLSLRAISDGPRAPIPLDLGEIMDEDANLLMGRLLKAVVRHPGIILRGRRMMRNTTLAADHAAIAVVAALKRW